MFLNVLPLKTDIDKCLRDSKSCGAARFWTMNRGLNIDGKNFQIKKLTCPAVSSRSTDSEQVVIHAVLSARMPANINKVEDLAHGQGDKPRKQFTMENCEMD